MCAQLRLDDANISYMDGERERFVLSCLNICHLAVHSFIHSFVHLRRE